MFSQKEAPKLMVKKVENFVSFVLPGLFLLFIASGFSDAANYFTKLPIYGGEVDQIALCASNPSVIYACGSYGGLWVSKDAGENWETTAFYDTPTSGTGAGIVGGATYVAVHPVSANIVIASQFGSFANKLFRSEDYGQTWQETGNSEIYAQNVNIVKIAASQKNAGTFYLLGNNFTTSNGVFYKSTDAGITWTKTADIGSGKAVCDLCVDENDVMYAALANAVPAADVKFDSVSSGWIYKSIDGITWNNVKTFNSVPLHLECSANTLAVGAGGGIENGVNISTDGGVSYVRESDGVGEVAVSTDGYKVYNYNNYSVNVATYNGSAWSSFNSISQTLFSSSRSVTASTILIDPLNPQNLYISDSMQYAFVKSTDAGVTWRISNKGLGGLIVYDGCKDPAGNIYVLGRTSVFKSVDNGSTWNETFNSSAQFEKGVISAPTTSYVFVAGYGKIWRSADGGANWSEALSVNGCGTANKIVFNKDNPAIGYAAFYYENVSGPTSAKYIYKTSDYGASWTNLDLAGYSVQALAIDPQDPSVIYAGLGDLHPTQNTKFYSYGGLWKIVDNGSTVSWSKLGLDNKIPYRIVVDSGGIIIASCIEESDPTPYKYNRPTLFSTDGGANWKEVSINTIGLTSANDIEFSEGVYYLATGDGVYASNNLLASFQLIAHKKDIGDPKCLIVGSMYAGANRGLYRLSWALSAYGGDKVKAYAFPNPFKADATGFTTLKYFVPAGKTADSLKISIYNLAGELVYEAPEQSNLSGGNAYYFAWDGKNQGGSLCGRGIYIVVFKSNLETARTKVVLTK